MTITTLTRRVVTEEVQATLLEEVEIHRASVVYFLLLLGELVYVGQSNNIHSALTRHRDKEFDQAFIRKVDPGANIDLLEQACIVYLRPKYNKTVHSRKIPMAKAELIVTDFLGIEKAP